MKKVLFAAVILSSALLISSCAKDRVKGCTDPFSINYNPAATDEDGSCFMPSAAKHALIGDFTGTWCPWCGEWGGPEFDACVETSGDKCVPMGIHVTDEMTTSESSSYDSEYSDIVSGYPTLYVWNQGSYTDGGAMSAAVDAEVADQVADIGAIAGFKEDGDNINMTVTAEVFTAVTGDYYVAAYLMENGLNYTQQVESTGPDATWIHDHVIRASSNGNIRGEQFVWGSGQQGQTFSKTYTIPKGSNWTTANMYCIAIIWQYDAATDDYTFVNVASSEGTGF